MIHCMFCGKRMMDLEQAGAEHHDWWAHAECANEYDKNLRKH